jgi:hypothetical protein
MRVTYLAFCLVAALPSGAAAQQAAATPFWLLPMVDLDLRALTPVDVQLVAGPDGSRELALLQVGGTDPRSYTSGSVPNDTGYRVVAGGLRVGALIYGDRPYRIEEIPEGFAGLTLLQTKLQHKGVLDGRYAIVLATAKPCWVFVAIEENSLDGYKETGAPSWLQEFAPTGHEVATVRGDFRVFVKKAPAGRIALGPPCMDVNNSAMYFAFFATAQ